jgi:hypothetical protein
MEGTLLVMQSLVKHQIYHKLNLLDGVDFYNVIQHKDSIINAGKGATTFELDGSTTINTELKSNSRNAEGDHFSTSKDAIVNLQCNIDNFIKIYGEPFYPIFILDHILLGLIDIIIHIYLGTNIVTFLK